MLSQHYDAVWRWIDWPDRAGKVDTGIDLKLPGNAIQVSTPRFMQVLRTHPHPRQGRHRFLLHRVRQTAVHQPGDHLDHRPMGPQRRRRTGQPDDPRAADRARGDRRVTDRLGHRMAGGELEVVSTEAKRHDPRPYQQTASDAVFAEFAAGHDRGKLIMACGTGKTFTALKIAERTALRTVAPRVSFRRSVDFASGANTSGMDRTDDARHPGVRGVLGYEGVAVGGGLQHPTTCRSRSRPIRASLPQR